MLVESRVMRDLKELLIILRINIAHNDNKLDQTILLSKIERDNL